MGQCPLSPASPGHSKGLAVERRGMSKRMPYTEMDNITLTKLALISQRARKDPKFWFTSLAHLLNKGFMKECYYSLGKDRACAHWSSSTTWLSV